MFFMRYDVSVMVIFLNQRCELEFDILLAWKMVLIEGKFELRTWKTLELEFATCRLEFGFVLNGPDALWNV